MISDTFLIAFACTVAALAGVIWSGVKARRSLHYGLVVLLLGLLTWAIREAEIMGSDLVYEGASGVFRTIHFGAVGLTFLALPLLVVTGLRLAKKESPSHRKAHRAVAWVFICAVLATTALGTTMTLLAEKAQDPPAEATPAD